MFGDCRTSDNQLQHFLGRYQRREIGLLQLLSRQIRNTKCFRARHALDPKENCNRFSLKLNARSVFRDIFRAQLTAKVHQSPFFKVRFSKAKGLNFVNIEIHPPFAYLLKNFDEHGVSMKNQKSVTLGIISILFLCTAFTKEVDAQQESNSQPAKEHKFEKAIKKFEASDKDNLPKPNGTLFIGSSSIRLWKLNESFPEEGYINRGFGGSEIDDSIHFAKRIIFPYKPQTILLYAGDNDVANGKDADKVFADFKRFCELVHKVLPKTKVHFIAIKPSIKRWSMVGEMRKANGLIRDFANKNDLLNYIDVDTPMIGKDGTPMPALFAKDGLHLNKKGYELWTSIVKEALKK